MLARSRLGCQDGGSSTTDYDVDAEIREAVRGRVREGGVAGFGQGVSTQDRGGSGGTQEFAELDEGFAERMQPFQGIQKFGIDCQRAAGAKIVGDSIVSGEGHVGSE